MIQGIDSIRRERDSNHYNTTLYCQWIVSRYHSEDAEVSSEPSNNTGNNTWSEALKHSLGQSFFHDVVHQPPHHALCTLCHVLSNSGRNEGGISTDKYSQSVSHWIEK